MRHILTSLLFLLAITTQAEETTLKVATYNIDGLPQKILGFDINAEGPGTDGTTMIAQRLEESGWDVIGMNEDFNYHDYLTKGMPSYSFQTYTGNITASISIIASVLAKKYRFNADGLELATLDGIKVSNETIVPWKEEAVYGYLDNANDSLTKKGFRYYTLTLPDEHVVDMIILHADASSTWDAVPDKLAREAAMGQLYDFITEEITTTNPLIIMGDFNCHSTRDRLQELFIDRINAIEGMEMNDVRVVLNYREEIDKILYLNRSAASLTLTPISTEIVRDFTHGDEANTQLSDHYPVTATFSLTDKVPSSIISHAPSATTPTYYNLQGIPTTPSHHGIFIHNGRKVVR